MDTPEAKGRIAGLPLDHPSDGGIRDVRGNVVARWLPYQVTDTVATEPAPHEPVEVCLHCSDLRELPANGDETLCRLPVELMPSDLVAQVVEAVRVRRPVRSGLVGRLLRHAQAVELQLMGLASEIQKGKQ